MEPLRTCLRETEDAFVDCRMGALRSDMPVCRLAVFHAVPSDHPLLQTVVPPKLFSLLASQLDLGPPPRRKLLQCCSCPGLSIPRPYQIYHQRVGCQLRSGIVTAYI